MAPPGTLWLAGKQAWACLLEGQTKHGGRLITPNEDI